MIERKQINLQSSREPSENRIEQQSRRSKSRQKQMAMKKLNNSHLMKNSRSMKN